MKERLARIRLKDGSHVEITREDGDVVVSHDGREVTLKQATGRQTLDMAALLAGLGESEETDE